MTNSANPSNTEIRIAKAIARSGLCSRRDAEKWIFQGRVTINGKQLDTPACIITEKDVVMVDGKPLPDAQQVQLWRYNKPKGLVTTHKDPEGRPTVFRAIQDQLPRVISVGRLDINTEGLLLLTTDGHLARALELPSTGWLRRYRVRANGRVTEDQLKKLSNGITVDGVNYGPIEAHLEREQGTNCWLTVAFREGKNREVKNVLGALGLQVNRLIRTSYGPFNLGDLKPGELVEVKRKALIEQLGSKLSKEIGLSQDRRHTAKEGDKKPADGKQKPAARQHKPRNPKPGSPKSGSPKSGNHKSGNSRPGNQRNTQNRRPK